MITSPSVPAAIAGQVIVYGVPSMRILKYIGVFTPEPWQGYGYDEESKKVLRGGWINGKELTWGDSHHPALSETNGIYDGQFLFINDKANPRIAVIDLRDFETKQIVGQPHFHVGARRHLRHPQFRVCGRGHPVPRAAGTRSSCHWRNSTRKYRGGMTYWKFDRKAGRIDAGQVVLLRAAAL
jgi:nitrous-oxide reductase